MATINYRDPSTKQWIEIPTGITVDTSLSSTSENPVQNKVINSALNEKYTKPTGGIPKTELASDVQTSLAKANSALQSVKLESGTNNGTLKLTVNGTATDNIAVKNLGSAAFTAASNYATAAQGAKADSAIQKPSTPTTESAITINSSGTVSTKPLTSITGKSEVYVGSTTPTNPDEILWIDPNGTSGGGGSGGGKLYKHIITVNGTKTNGAPYDAVWSIIDNHNKTYTFQDVIGKYYPFAGGMPVLVYSDDPATSHFLALLTALYQIVVGTTVESAFGTATNFKDTVTEL